MISGIGLLLGFQLAGETIAHLLNAPIPGAIIGLLLLFAWLKVRTRNERRPQDTVDDTEVGQVTSPLLRNLAILFVPSGVGVLEYGNVFADRGLIIVLILVASTLAAMAATALAFVAARTLLAQRPNGQRTVMQLGAIAVDSGSQ